MPRRINLTALGRFNLAFQVAGACLVRRVGLAEGVRVTLVGLDHLPDGLDQRGDDVRIHVVFRQPAGAASAAALISLPAGMVRTFEKRAIAQRQLDRGHLQLLEQRCGGAAGPDFALDVSVQQIEQFEGVAVLAGRIGRLPVLMAKTGKGCPAGCCAMFMDSGRASSRGKRRQRASSSRVTVTSAAVGTAIARGMLRLAPIGQRSSAACRSEVNGAVDGVCGGGVGMERPARRFDGAVGKSGTGTGTGAGAEAGTGVRAGQFSRCAGASADCSAACLLGLGRLSFAACGLP
ncbi:hypothetical protein [Thermomonas sp.]|uniref:hypothetical protein n=1 Tax=Thermomonas sp. TaxID=1971895 RepID=UPI00263378D6|nr:hypothetical protein [Thermomonas sp.]